MCLCVCWRWCASVSVNEAYWHPPLWPSDSWQLQSGGWVGGEEGRRWGGGSYEERVCLWEEARGRERALHANCCNPRTKVHRRGGETAQFFSKLQANANVAAGASAAVVLLKTAHINILLRQTQINSRKGSAKMWRIWGFFCFCLSVNISVWLWVQTSNMQTCHLPSCWQLSISTAACTAILWESHAKQCDLPLSISEVHI